MFYLTGFNEPDSCLVLDKTFESSELNVKFFASPNDIESLLWSGPRAGIEGCKEIFGLQNVYEMNKLDDFVSELKYQNSSTVFMDYHAEHSSLKPELFKILNEKMKMKSFESIVSKLRLVKTAGEQSLLRISGSIAAESFKEV